MSSALFSLIKSLTKTEKRHFKLFASKHVKGDKNSYVRLFDAIEKQQEYDEQVLIKTEKYISNLAVLKLRLYDAILKSLRAYRANTSLENKLRAEVDYIQILLSKGLLAQARKALQKAKKKAEQYEFLTILMEVFNCEIKIMNAESYQYNTFDDITKIYSKLDRVLQKQSEINKNALFETMVFAALKKSGQPNSIKEEKQLKKIITPYYVSGEKFASYSALLLNFRAKASYNTLIYNYKQASYFFDKMVRLIEQHSHIEDSKPRLYENAIYNSIINTILSRNFSSKVFNDIEKLKKIEYKKNDAKSKILTLAGYTELAVYCLTGEFEKALKLTTMYSNEAIYYNDVIRIGIEYYKAYLHFGLRNYKLSNNM